VNLFDDTESVKGLLYRRNGVSHVFVNPYTEKIYVEYDPAQVSWEEVRRLVCQALHPKDESRLITVREHRDISSEPLRLLQI
jgi:hypothetical protein